MTFGLTVLKSNWSPPPHGVCVRFQVCVSTPLAHTHTLWCLYIGSVAVLPAAIWVTHHAWVDTKRHTLEDIQTYRTHIHTQRWVQWLSHQLVMSLRHQQVCVCVHHYLEAGSALKAFVFLPLFNNVPQTSNLILEALRATTGPAAEDVNPCRALISSCSLPGSILPLILHITVYTVWKQWSCSYSNAILFCFG